MFFSLYEVICFHFSCWTDVHTTELLLALWHHHQFPQCLRGCAVPAEALLTAVTRRGGRRGGLCPSILEITLWAVILSSSVSRPLEWTNMTEKLQCYSLGKERRQGLGHVAPNEKKYSSMQTCSLQMTRYGKWRFGL